MRNRDRLDENFYIILGVDYKKPETDINVIMAKIESQKAALSQKLNNPAKSGKAGAYLKLIQSAEIKRVMMPADSDVEGQKLRQEEAEAAANAVENKILEEINSVASKARRNVKKSVLKNIIEDVDGLKLYQVTYSMVEEVCSCNSITIVDDTAKKSNSKYLKIKRDLEGLKLVSFYDYLASYIVENKNSIYKQFSSSEQLSKLSAKELQDITLEAYGYYSKFQAGIKDNQTQLSGYHKVLFEDENSKQIYDISLQSDKNSLPEDVVYAIQDYIDTQMNHDKAKELIQLCKNFNPLWERDEIIDMLKAEVKKNCAELFC